MSDLGNLSQCLVDSDLDARARARNLRRKALVISIVLEALVVVAMILWPLFSPAVLATSYNVTPAPPYSGGGASNHPRTAPHRPSASRLPAICLAVCAPVARPEAPVGNSDAPDIDQNEGAGVGAGQGPGPIGTIIPGAAGSGSAPEAPPPPPRPSRPVSMSEGVLAAMLLHRVDPPYPTLARAAHISGAVHLHAIIGKDGTVRQLEIVDGNLLLAQAAKTAVQNWRYRPTILNGQAVEVETYITVNFVLN